MGSGEAKPEDTFWKVETWTSESCHSAPCLQSREGVVEGCGDGVEEMLSSPFLAPEYPKEAIRRVGDLSKPGNGKFVFRSCVQESKEQKLNAMLSCMLGIVIYRS